MSTCFLTSNLLQDLDPAAVSSGNLRVEMTKLEFDDVNKVTRDKVRCPERSYMAAGAAVHPSSENPSVIFCTQGLLHEAAGLVSIEARPPHKPRMILNNFHGKPFNSPFEIVSNPVDNAVYFTVST
jgi:gluconolactonase